MAEVLDRICPVCGGEGGWPCWCDGDGLVTAAEAATWQENNGEVLKVVPPPPAEMKGKCGDCAFRPDSQEYGSGLIYQLGNQVEDGTPFFCHQGMHVTADGRYQPREVDAAGHPVGHPLCAGYVEARRRVEQLAAR